jgi:hypothetical protein
METRRGKRLGPGRGNLLDGDRLQCDGLHRGALSPPRRKYHKLLYRTKCNSKKF